MKKILVLVLLIIIVAPVKAPLAHDLLIEEQFEQAIQMRMKFLEKVHGIKFDPDWRPKVSFSTPKFLPEDVRGSWSAAYNIETQTIFLHPAHKMRHMDLDKFKGNVYTSRNSWKPGIDLRTLFDHELGHVFPDQISRLYGYGEWPKAEFSRYEYSRKLAIRLAMEGIATYFEQTSIVGKIRCSDIFPERMEDANWNSANKELLYTGGYCLVEPIIRHYGEKGILHLITTPVVFKNDKLRKTIEEYQVNALYELSNQK